MKQKYKKEGMSFKCFHNRGHPERWSPRSPEEFTALERVAVMSDEIAERVGMFVEEPQAVPYIPGRKRWTVSYKGEEIVKPLRRQLKMLAKIRHNEIYCAETRESGLAAAAEETSRDTIAGCRRSNTASIGSNYSVARHSYLWLMTNHAMVKKRIVADSEGAADCSCNEPQNTAFLMQITNLSNKECPLEDARPKSIRGAAPGSTSAGGVLELQKASKRSKELVDVSWSNGSWIG
jgi:hypothetical protein